jgi:cytochrome c
MRILTTFAVVVGLVTIADADAIGQAAKGPAAGRAFALQVCTPCHVVARHQLSPSRFATAPDFRAIATTRGMTETSLHAFLSSSHPTMPNLILSQSEQDKIIAYILSLRDRP